MVKLVRMSIRAQLEQSKNRLCLNLNRQKKDPLPAIKETTSSTHSSRGYRVSDITSLASFYWFINR